MDGVGSSYTPFFPPLAGVGHSLHYATKWTGHLFWLRQEAALYATAKNVLSGNALEMCAVRLRRQKCKTLTPTPWSQQFQI